MLEVCRRSEEGMGEFGVCAGSSLSSDCSRPAPGCSYVSGSGEEVAARSCCGGDPSTARVATCDCGRHTFIVPNVENSGQGKEEGCAGRGGDVNMTRREQAAPRTERGMEPVIDIENINMGMPLSSSRTSGKHKVGEVGSSLPLDRIVVDPQGNLLVVEPSVVCDACPACEDTCSLPKCRGCDERRAALRREGRPRTAFTLCEIRRHRTLGSCWLVAKRQVYDVTPYLAHHPAGALAIARKAGGVDCTEDLEFHSGKAQKLWKHFRIGVVKSCPSQSGGRYRGEGGACLGDRYSDLDSAAFDGSGMPMCMIM